MKIGILTYYGVHNHGAVLQANALKTVLQSLGHEVEFLSFSRNYDNISIKNNKKYKLGFASIPFYVKYALNKGFRNILFNIKKSRILNKYRKAYLPIMSRYSDFQGDVVIIGSDEVFSLEIGINPFFYGHGIQSKKILSYAGCFGPTDKQFLFDHNLVGLVESGFKRMQKIGVRDFNSKMIVEEICDKQATLVCDPVILYGYQQEMNLYKPKQKDYILVYAYDKNLNDEKEYSQIKTYAKKHKLKVYSLGYHHKWCDRNINVSPYELLGYIKNAKLVVTDTFHGAVMSIVGNTPMVVKLRDNVNKLGFLLNEYELEDQIIEDFSEIGKIAEQEIDFEKINNIINNKRQESMNFLVEALNND